MHQARIQIATSGRGLVDITQQVRAVVQAASPDSGLCHVFVHHTSASLIIQENADPDVQRDLDAFLHLASSRGAPLTIDDLRKREGGEVLGVHYITQQWTEQEFGLDLSHKASELGATGVLPASEETISLVLKHQNPLKMVAIRNFLSAGGREDTLSFPYHRHQQQPSVPTKKHVFLLFL